MKFKSTLTCFLFLLASLIFWSCQKEEVNPPRGKYENGAFIINEGNFTQANGSISFYDIDSNKVVSDVFKLENGREIGATIQNMYEYIGRLYIVTNNPGKIEIVDNKTFKSIATINNGLNNPFSFAAVGSRAYVSCWGIFNNTTFKYDNPYIAIIDLENNTVLNTLARNAQPQHLLAIEPFIYVGNVNSSVISVLNTVNNLFEASITVPAGPDQMMLDANNKLWVMCRSGSFVRINPISNSVETTISGIQTAGFNEKFVMNGGKNRIYYLAPEPFPSSNVKVFLLNTNATSAPTTPLITGQNFYGIGVDPVGNTIYIGETGGFTANAKVFRYNVDGTFRDNLTAGIAPNGFFFRR